MGFLNLLKSIDLQNFLVKSSSLNPVIQRFLNLFCVKIVAYQCYNLAQDFRIQSNQMSNYSFEYRYSYIAAAESNSTQMFTCCFHVSPLQRSSQLTPTI